MDRGLVAHVLHEARDIADPKQLFEAIPATRPDAEMVQLATQLIDRQVAAFDPADMEDRYESRLRDVIDAKLHGKGVQPAAEEAPSSNVIDLMAALRRSLGQAPAATKASTKSAGAKAPKAKPAKSVAQAGSTGARSKSSAARKRA
jgi:DNA end-binding protein Ku